MLRIHFIGIGGIGVSALAKYYLAQGARVSGSDAVRSEITDELKGRGVTIAIGHRAKNVPRECDRVIYSAAVKPDNRERVEAALRMIPQKSYAEVIGELTRKYFTIAISGSHGKSTTTALVALILVRAGLDPTVIVGTRLREWGGENFRMGRSKYLVLEADEWNRSFHEYSSDIVVLTNIDKEHLDTYKTYGGVVAGFARYLRNLKPRGIIVANWGDRGVRRAIATSDTRQATRKIVWYNRGKFRRHPLAIPGAHNQVNAEAAWQTVRVLDVRRSTADAVFRRYRGAWRRLEALGVRGSMLKIFRTSNTRHPTSIYSDYAHHPTEIKATLEALREKYPRLSAGRRSELIAVFQPHQQDRLTRLFKEFTQAFREADRVIFVPTYAVKGREYRKGKTAEDLAKAIRGARYARTLREALKLANLSNRTNESNWSNRVLVFMSAGDLDSQVRKLLV